MQSPHQSKCISTSKVSEEQMRTPGRPVASDVAYSKCSALAAVSQQGDTNTECLLPVLQTCMSEGLSTDAVPVSVKAHPSACKK